MSLFQMDIHGIRRRGFTPQTPPPRLFRSPRRGVGKVAPVFEPYEESLPLQSGHYSYVIDPQGRFRVRWGNTRSHAAMAGANQVAAAGRFSVNRQGSVYHVVCSSSDFTFHYRGGARDPSVAYTIAAFRGHEAFALHPDAVFQFHTGIVEKFYVSAAGATLTNPQAQLKALEDEGRGAAHAFRFTPVQRCRFAAYCPAPPPRLYGMHVDQDISDLEESSDRFAYGPPCSRLDPSLTEFSPGKGNFVIDEQGGLIIGMTGHQILSGGGLVGGAGHLHIEPTGLVTRVDLNFSGHYRPPLTADYVRYVYRVLAGHPLVVFAERPRYFGRLFDEVNVTSTVIEFSKEELESDCPELQDRIDLLIVLTARRSQG